jgi:ribosomal protein S27AE
VIEGAEAGSKMQGIFDALGMLIKGVQSGCRLELTGFKGVGKQGTVLEHHVWSSVIQLLYLGHEMHVFKRRDSPRVNAMEMLVVKEPDNMKPVTESNKQCSNCTAGFIMRGRETNGTEVMGLQSDPLRRKQSKQQGIVANRLLCRQQHRVFIREVSDRNRWACGQRRDEIQHHSSQRRVDGPTFIKAAMEGVNSVQD